MMKKYVIQRRGQNSFLVQDEQVIDECFYFLHGIGHETLFFESPQKAQAFIDNHDGEFSDAVVALPFEFKVKTFSPVECVVLEGDTVVWRSLGGKSLIARTVPELLELSNNFQWRIFYYNIKQQKLDFCSSIDQLYNGCAWFDVENLIASGNQ